MFVCAGPGVAATERAEPVSVMDFHPTICRLLGLPDAGVDGAVIDEIVTPRT
jgi:arylsulfatase A-like enzyme